jgi:5-formyltetrahydrofolate cyclo-ligase
MMPPTLIAQKQAMRAEARERRAILNASVQEAPRKMARQFLAAIPMLPNATVSAYFPVGDEADPLPLIEQLRAKGHAIALPRVAGVKHTPLAFHVYPPDARLIRHRFGMHEPVADWTIAIPSVVIVPLLAFDARGHRLGYGAGYYDATLADLRRGHDVMAVGYAYAGQEVPEVPADQHDQKLDWVVTEAGARRFDRTP